MKEDEWATWAAECEDGCSVTAGSIHTDEWFAQVERLKSAMYVSKNFEYYVGIFNNDGKISVEYLDRQHRIFQDDYELDGEIQVLKEFILHLLKEKQ